MGENPGLGATAFCVEKGRPDHGGGQDVLESDAD